MGQLEINIYFFKVNLVFDFMRFFKHIFIFKSQFLIIQLTFKLCCSNLNWNVSKNIFRIKREPVFLFSKKKYKQKFICTNFLKTSLKNAILVYVFHYLELYFKRHKPSQLFTSYSQAYFKLEKAWLACPSCFVKVNYHCSVEA